MHMCMPERGSDSHILSGNQTRSGSKLLFLSHWVVTVALRFESSNQIVMLDNCNFVVQD